MKKKKNEKKNVLTWKKQKQCSFSRIKHDQIFEKKNCFTKLKFYFKTGGKMGALWHKAPLFFKFMDLNEFLSDFYANTLLL